MLNNIGIPGLLLIAVAVLFLFGRGKISSLMGEVGQGLSAFRKGLEEDKTPTEALEPDVHEEIDTDIEVARLPVKSSTRA